jgi:acetyl esterase/lipase
MPILKYALLGILFPITVLGGELRSVRVEKDLPYLGADRKEKFDLYMPADPSPAERFPGVVIIHGGGWVGGDKGARREQNIGNTLAANGYVCISINYVLATDGHPTWPRNLQECKRAVQHLRKNADELHVDPRFIGGSAGGHLATMVGLTGPDAGLDPTGPDAEISCQVQAAVDLYGPVTIARDTRMLPGTRAEVPELYRQASPLTHISPDDPPILILHGTKDTTVPLEESKILAAALAKVGHPHEFVIVKDAPHTFHLQPKQRDLRPVVLGFFDKYLKPQ